MGFVFCFFTFIIFCMAITMPRLFPWKTGPIFTFQNMGLGLGYVFANFTMEAGRVFTF